MQCFQFHLYAGVRAGGGIGDEIESPDGDDYQNWRILFDITFFFFVIVILLAIIQGVYIGQPGIQFIYIYSRINIGVGEFTKISSTIISL